MYNFKDIEEKWEKRWEDEKSFKAIDFHPSKPKYYVLYEFYNISGNLHMGHLKGSVPADALARMKRFQGYNVLFPIGGDSFGLPAENVAIKTGIDPKVFVENGMRNVIAQSKKIGLSFDYDRAFATSDEEYYKWTQWIFLQFYKAGKAYKEKGVVNFCPNCKTVLSNEDSQGGLCDRCHGKVVQAERWVWFLKMKEYSEKLLGNVDRINMNENLKELQRNWIGKSEGMRVKFDIVDENNNNLTNAEIFTTCPETIYGITFMVMAPEHELVTELKEKINNYEKVKKYQEQTKYRSELDRMSNIKEKTGCRLEGIYAINPINGNKVPIYIADFVLAGYGTGIVMAVPTHDQRDYEFAKEFNIPMIQVIEGNVETHAVEKGEYLAKNSRLINSAEFSGMPVKEAKEKIKEKLISIGKGTKETNYKMQDWSFNRQRYWGEPFPIVFCEKCGTVPVKEEELPVKLPKTEDYMPREDGSSPLSKVEEWVNCKCPKCGGPAKRETDTMPNWAGSSWYWLRYCDPHNKEKLADIDKLKYWGSVDCYTGGTEHITRHVLYAFFWQNFLYEIGAVPTRDPFIRKMGSGLILDDTGKKMSKSSANGVSPMEVIEKYGSDVARLHVHFLGGYEDNIAWTYDGINGIVNFINKIWDLQNIIKEGQELTKEQEYDINLLTKKITEDLEDLKLNTSIAAFMSYIKKIKERGSITKEELRTFLILLNPLAPHITSEMYERVFDKNILEESWPTFDENKLNKDSFTIIIQVNGKVRGKVSVSSSTTNEEILSFAKTIENVKTFIDGKEIIRVITVPKKLVNIVVK